MSAQVARAYLLTTELRGPRGQKMLCVLPCVERDLTRWLAASRQTDRCFDLEKLVRNNPTLFLMAISRAVDCSRQKVHSMVQLLARLDHCFQETESLETVLGHVADVRATPKDFLEEVQTQATVADFRKARGRKKLAKSLAKFVCLSNRRYLCKRKRTSKNATREFIKTLLASSFRAAPARKTSCSIENRFVEEPSTIAAIEGLICDRQKRKQEFDAKLQTAKLSAMKQLAYGASHEINNPLANIATRAQTLLANENDPDRRFQLAVVHEQAMRAHDMISDMMLFAHPPKLELKTVNVPWMLSRIVRDCSHNLGPLIRSATQLFARVANGVSVATIDEGHCRVVLESLIQNSAEAISHEHGEINIHVSRHDQDIVFSVSDNGRGVDAHVQEHVFDPFFSGREAGRGLGFGLSKSWRIAQLHGGSLTWRVDEESRNTVFEFRIPHRCEAF